MASSVPSAIETNGFAAFSNDIPKTHEKVDTSSSQTSVTAFPSTKVSEGEIESPLVRSKKNSKRAVLSDSEEDKVVVKKRRKKTKKAEPKIENDSCGREIERVQESFLSNKELGLKSLMTKFPKHDLMMIQDTLSLCQWNNAKAAHILEDHCEISSCTHFPNKPESTSPEEDESSEEEPAKIPPLPFETVHKTLKTIDGWLSKPRREQFSHKPNAPIRRRIQELSSSDEEDTCIKNDNEENKIVSEDSLPSNSKSQARKLHDLSDDDENGDDSKAEKPKTSSLSTFEETKASIASFKNDKSSKSKKKKKKRRRDVKGDSDEYDDDYGKDDVYDSGDDSDCEIDDTETPARMTVVKFYNESVTNELLAVSGINKKKFDIIVSLRPFTGWADMVRKFKEDRMLSTDLLNSAREVIHMREVMSNLMAKCERTSKEMEKLYSKVKGKENEALIKEQPSILNKDLTLAPYQMVGLNWLYLMHMKDLNGILADEMGLGKTIQAIAFLGHLYENNERGPHLIVVPASVLENWVREIQLWCNTFSVIIYRGSQSERRELRLQLVNNEVDFQILITTYNMVGSLPEDRALFKRLQFHYVIFDEAHMLKNMASVRYKNLMGIKAHRRLCLTGTPLQNNLVELMSLLIFVMPGMFQGKIDQVRRMFTSTCKTEEHRSAYERDRIEHAKNIMKPFVLRRLKSEVLKQLPAKLDEVRYVPMSVNQKKLYNKLADSLKNDIILDDVDCIEEGESLPTLGVKTGGSGMVMELRKAANHPLLRRCIYKDSTLRKIASKLMKEKTYADANEQYIFEDFQVCHDYQIHKICLAHKSTKQFALTDEKILDSGKFEALDAILAEWQAKGERVLIFSQFVMMLDIIEDYMKIKQHKYIRLDGSTPVGDRQDLIDNFTGDKDVFVFLLSTRAGGLGINLTAANVVVIHDIDYNPYNDKQAEDRCHRVGQTREVTVIRMISQGTIEEGMLHCAQEKLRLEKNITTTANADESKTLASSLLKSALGYSQVY